MPAPAGPAAARPAVLRPCGEHRRGLAQQTGAGQPPLTSPGHHIRQHRQPTHTATITGARAGAGAGAGGGAGAGAGAGGVRPLRDLVTRNACRTGGLDPGADGAFVAQGRGLARNRSTTRLGLGLDRLTAGDSASAAAGVIARGGHDAGGGLGGHPAQADPDTERGHPDRVRDLGQRRPGRVQAADPRHHRLGQLRGVLRAWLERGPPARPAAAKARSHRHNVPVETPNPAATSTSTRLAARPAPAAPPPTAGHRHRRNPRQRPRPRAGTPAHKRRPPPGRPRRRFRPPRPAAAATASAASSPPSCPPP
jgi:hypothetical protein